MEPYYASRGCDSPGSRYAELRDKELTEDSSFSVLLWGIDNGAHSDTEVVQTQCCWQPLIQKKRKRR